MAKRSPPASAAADDHALSFEAGIDRLELIVDRLERGELALEDALGLFEEGVRLSRGLAEQLKRAERRVELLVQDGEETRARPLEEPEEPR